MSTSEFLAYGTAGGANVMSQASYNGSPARTGGVGSGIADSSFINKAMRQSATGVAALMQAVANLTGTNIADDGNLSNLTALVTAAFQAGIANACPPGTPVPYLGRSTVPAGFILGNGGTIGDGSSGASTRANADTFNLYSLIWGDFTDGEYPVTTSGGGASTRGASAAADFAAHKRMRIFDLRAQTIRFNDDGRGVDSGRVVGIEQLDAFQNISGVLGGVFSNYQNSPPGDWSQLTGPFHTYGSTRTGYSGAGEHISDVKLDTSTDGTLRTATETRMRNMSVRGLIKL